MRPLKLEICAFGPFNQNQSIDLSAFGTNPLFLINGQTGSGKTTILDAICFALYGQTTGNEREAKEMRCHHSPSSLSTEVKLEFELGPNKYLIERSPEQEIAKKSGEGTTKKLSIANFWKLENGEQNLIATKTKEVTSEVETLLGLSVAQFRQVIVLPQGKFRELLTADSKKREEIFSKLFQTQIYKKLEYLLEEKAKDIRIKKNNQDKINMGLLEASGFETSEELEAKIIELTPIFSEIKTKLEISETNLISLEKKKSLQIKIIEQFQKLSETQDQLSDHKSKESKNLEDKGLFENASSAQLIEKDYVLLKSTASLHSENLHQDSLNTKRLNESKSLLSIIENEFKEKDALVKSLTSKNIRLGELRGIFKIHNDLEAENLKKKSLIEALNSSKNKEESENALLINLKANSSQFEKKIKRSEIQLETLDLSSIQKSISKIDISINLHSDYSIKSNYLLKVEDEITSINKLITTASKNTSNASTQLKMLQLKWHNAQASILAMELISGSDCPVCGSKDHPSPAKTISDMPHEDDLVKAEEVLSCLMKDENLLKEKLSSLRAKREEIAKNLIELEMQLGDDLKVSSSELKKNKEKFLQDIQSHQELKDLIKSSKIELDQSRKTLEDKENTLEVLKNSKIKAEGDLNILTSSLERLDSSLPNEYKIKKVTEEAGKNLKQDVDSLTNKINTIDKKFNDSKIDFEKAKNSKKHSTTLLNKSTKDLELSNNVWVSTLSESAFEDENLFKEALTLIPRIKCLKDEIKNYDLVLNKLLGSLDTQKNELKDKTLPNLSILTSGIEKALLQKEEYSVSYKEINTALTTNIDISKKLESNNKNLSKLDEQYKDIGTLADVANGKTGAKVSLQRFVLSVLLDDVLEDASRRLKSMSKGRYALTRKLDKSKGNKASGLDIEIDDFHTGRKRSVNTLSGGESFLAALSLALGLSDVVTAYSGGVRLDTLFIDEGFGSLDPESLDLAIKTLIDLQSDGKMVGVISHVEALKEQMPLRIDIKEASAGSQISLKTI